ncbi:hypothetical protein ACH4ZU_27635 [Streptomyces sp. NPDC020472]|uniref:hypothetical protein n=1 Tax=Streptomyces sp. NPDC020472 TaxID=3365075 RepID=UPI00378F111A
MRPVHGGEDGLHGGGEDAHAEVVRAVEAAAPEEAARLTRKELESALAPPRSTP